MEERILMSVDSERTLAHIGVLEKSGRYPWGSGERPFQRLQDWQGYVRKLQKEGMSKEDIAKGCGMTLDELNDSLISTNAKRNQTTIRNAQKKVADVAMCWELKNKGWSQTAIAERLGVTEGTVRNYLKPGADARAQQLLNIGNTLKDAVDSKGYIDVGANVNLYLHTTDSKMKASIDLLKEEGYQVFYVKQKQAGTGLDTTIKVLAGPDANFKEFKTAFDADPSVVKPIDAYSNDGGTTIQQIQKPVPISRDRIYVRYDDDEVSGSLRDGVIQIRRGVEDLDLLDSNYAQVRISVDDKMYMKGMAIYSDDIPEGYDCVYNVNKKRGTPDEKVFKKMYGKGEDDPFGASIMMKGVDEETGNIIYQKDYIGKDGKLHRSALNIVNDEGSWDDWSKTIASQMLSKQSPELAKKQLKLVTDSKQDELDEIMSLTNPTVRKKMLEEYAEGCDSDAVHLKAAAFPRQKTQVLIPIPSLSEKECYAPNFNDGETVVLIRYPHGGTFEIPELHVNNKNKEGISTLTKNPVDAIGINSATAAQLSGADFDGDSVLVIPNNNGAIKVSKVQKDLQTFDPKASYKKDIDPYEGLSTVEAHKLEARLTRTKNIEMGKVSNLITDMTIKGAELPEIIRAVKHSMVVIDSVKHNLDYKQSEKDFGIQALRDKYQPKEEEGKPGGGASTLISRAKSEARVTKRSETTSVKGMTDEERAAWERGEKVYREAKDAKYDEYRVLLSDTGEKTFEKTGVTKTRQIKSTQMAETKDARELSSGTVIEEVYAEHANTLKSLANRARAEARKTPRLEKSPSAAKVYAEEVSSLNAKLERAKKNAPLERQAQLLAGARVKAQIYSNPELSYDKDALKKTQNKALQYARMQMGANKKEAQVKITDREWEAIQAGAISDSKLMEILKNTDMESVKKRATPRATESLSSAQLTRIKAMISNGLTQAEIAEMMNVSTSTVSSVAKGKIS